jgi:hypothetical protein
VIERRLNLRALVAPAAFAPPAAADGADGGELLSLGEQLLRTVEVVARAIEARVQDGAAEKLRGEQRAEGRLQWGQQHRHRLAAHVMRESDGGRAIRAHESAIIQLIRRRVPFWGFFVITLLKMVSRT